MFIVTEGVTDKEALIKLSTVSKAASARKVFGLISGCLKRSLSVLESKALNHEHIYLRQGIGFLFDNDIRMRQHKFFVIKEICRIMPSPLVTMPNLKT